ncbi:MAG: rod shape-determining protein RodA [Armatimonadota bacterium]|nr:rod shape-determining protein RodA [Armatimonadota bacterium]
MMQRARPIDLTLLGAALALALVGLVAIYSATYDDGPGTFRKQAVWVVLSFCLALVVRRVDYRLLVGLSRSLYVLNLLALLLVKFFGTPSNGAVRWISLGSFKFQPSEFSKLITIISLTAFVQSHASFVRRLGGLCLSLAYVLPSVVLILKQPDLGTSLVLLVVWCGIVYVAGAQPKHLAAMGIAGVLAFAGLWHTDKLKEYQKQRIFSFLNPSADPQHTGWHTLQSKIAIGSGGLTGKGLFRGTQGQHGFIPEQHTDFINTVIGEELGFVGSVVVLALFFTLIYRALRIAVESNDPHGRLIAVGIAAMFTFQVFVNLGMTIHLMPITGLPLPFVSYGGSSMMVNMLAVGVLLNIHRYREELRF